MTLTIHDTLSRKKTAFMGGVASIVFGVGLALILEIMNPAIRNATQLERALGIQTVVSIPVVQTQREQRMRNVMILGWLLGMLALVPAALRVINDRWPNINPFDTGERQAARL